MKKSQKQNHTLRSPADIGPALKLIRNNLHLTQNALSEMTGIKQQTLSAIESGTQLANLKTLFAILSTLNLELVVNQRSQRIKGFAPGSNF
ncbi:MAG: helix-turn-helix transcriptional regulator [Bdellovibrionales bacterium]